MVNNKGLFFGFLLVVSVSMANGAEPLNMLSKAVRIEDMRSVRQIIKNCGIDGAYLPIAGWTCLMEAADYGRIKIIEFCLSKQANMEMGDLRGNTALAWSLLQTYYSPKRLAFYKLLFHGADYATQNDNGGTVVSLINALNSSPKSKERIKKRATSIVEDLIYWLCKGLSKKGNVPEDVIVASVLPYIYGDIQAHNENVKEFLTIDCGKFFNQQAVFVQLKYNKVDRKPQRRVSNKGQKRRKY